MPIGTSFSIGLWGLKAYTIQIQAFTSPGLPAFSIIGLPDTSLAEARERVKSACMIAGFTWPQTRVTVNLPLHQSRKADLLSILLSLQAYWRPPE